MGPDPETPGATPGDIPTPAGEGGASALIAGKYRYVRTLGKGGMGVVVEARPPERGAPVAIKFLRPELAGSPEACERFLREARASIRIRSEHVARVFDVGTAEGVPFMVMEYLEGEDLARVLRRGPLPVGDAVDFALQAALALAEAHARGIVHRDVKPANFFLTRRPDGSPQVRLLDFGISKAAGDASLTRGSPALGSVAYMAPEQLRQAKSADHRMDVYALGVSLYELLAGRRPFEARGIAELCVAILQRAPAPLAPRRPELPEGLVLAVDRAMAREPSARFGSVAELGLALAPFAPPRSRPCIEALTRLAIPPEPLPAAGGWRARAAKRAGVLAALGGALAAVLVVAVMFGARGVPSPPSPPSPPSGPSAPGSGSPSPPRAAVSGSSPPAAPIPEASAKKPPGVHRGAAPAGR